MKYDFVLFDQTEAINHQKDVEMIALLLQKEGWKVAIAEVYNEHLYCKNKDIPHIVFDKIFTDRFLPVEEESNVILRFFKNRLIMHKYQKYLRYVAKELSKISNNIYVGSHENGFPLSWLKDIDNNVNVFIWGLRSYRLYEHKLTKSPIIAYNSWRSSKLLSSHSNIFFFVSDELIKEEFINVGIPSQRLIIRRERTTSGIKYSSNTKSGITTFLTIGSIRPDKQVERVIRAFRNISNNELRYIIAGKTSERDKYESIISKEIGGDTRIKRLNYRLSEEEFNNLLETSDFLILCDRKQTANVTNGTMNEGLLKGKPIIAPDYDPYKFFIDRCKIGYAFDPEDQQSLIRVILNAQNNGNTLFKEAIIKYQKQLLFDEIASELSNEIKIKQHS